MLESIVTNQPKLSKEEYKPYHDALVDRLVVLQQEAKKAGTGVVVLFEGWKGAGKGSRISDLIYHLDARGVSVHVTEDFDPAEAERTRSSDFGATGYYPTMQQFWKALGPRDAITIFDRGWYSALIDHVFNEMHINSNKKRKRVKKRARQTVDAAVEEIRAFERQLVDDGYIVVKFFFHITEKTQRERLLKLYNDPATSWRVSDRDLRQMLDYPAIYKLYDQLLESTDFDEAPWTLLAAEDKRRANLAVAEELVNLLDRSQRKRRTPLPSKQRRRQRRILRPRVMRMPMWMSASVRLKRTSSFFWLLKSVCGWLSSKPHRLRIHHPANYPRLEEVNHTLFAAKITSVSSRNSRRY